MNSILLSAQDTFSIVAIDKATGEVGSAGASCVDLTFFPNFSTDFLADLIPGEGAINTQAFYNEANQQNALQQFQNGSLPQEVIDWLVQNDVERQPQIRQYGIIRMRNDTIYGAAHTGSSAPELAGEVIGEDFVVVANLMATQDLADSMAVAFRNAEGALSCRLMAALDAAKRQGGDSRCTPDGISSLFAFVKTSRPDASPGSPSFLASVRTRDGDGIDAVDSLRVLHDLMVDCSLLNSTTSATPQTQKIMIRPNPAQDFIRIAYTGSPPEHIRIRDLSGRLIGRYKLLQNASLDISRLPNGIYFVLPDDPREWRGQKLIIAR